MQRRLWILSLACSLSLFCAGCGGGGGAVGDSNDPTESGADDAAAIAEEQNPAGVER